MAPLMLPRTSLPQIPSNKMNNFRKYCNGQGVSSKTEYINPKELIPIQKHLNKEKIKDLYDKGPSEDAPPIAISSDFHILDGHHRWASDLLHRESRILCIKFDCSISKLVKLGHFFDGSEIKSISEILLKEM